MMISRRLWRENRNLYICSLCNNGLRPSRPVVAWGNARRWNSNGPPKSSGWGSSSFVPRAPAKPSTADDLAGHEAAARRAILGSSSGAPKQPQKPAGSGSRQGGSKPPPKPSRRSSSGSSPRAPPAESKTSNPRSSSKTSKSQQNPSDPVSSSGDLKPPPRSFGWGASSFTPRAPQAERTLSEDELTARRALLSSSKSSAQMKGPSLTDALNNQPARDDWGASRSRDDRRASRGRDDWGASRGQDDRGASRGQGDGTFGRYRGNPRPDNGGERSDPRMGSPRPRRNEEFWSNFGGSDRGRRSGGYEEDLPNWNSLPKRPRQEAPPDTSQFEAFGRVASEQQKTSSAATQPDDAWVSKYSKPSRIPSGDQQTYRPTRDSIPTKHRGANDAPDWGSRQANSRDARREPARTRRGRGGGASRRQADEDDEIDEDAEFLAEERRRQRAEEKAARKAARRGGKEEVVRHQLFLPEYISVPDLAQVLNVPINKFLKALEEYGFEDIGQDSLFTGETAGLIAGEFGYEVKVDDGMARDIRPQPEPEDPTSVPPRPPVVAIMGHVDHGKTTLLDYLRKSSIVASEHGGITQHIGAFIVNLSSGKSITFLDTPGHAAFLTMRQRGAEVTDIVILVVAADDSVMPQTIEALKHARGANVPIIVAITKCDKEDARVDQVKADLSKHGVEIEDYGGDVQVVEVSGKTGQGMEDLEENIVTLSEILDVRGDPESLAEGWVIESSVKPVGKAATVLIKKGTLRIGDYLVCGTAWAKVRVLRNEAGQEIEEAGPGSPVEVLGWRDELPKAGDQALQPPDEATARTAIDYRREMQDRSEDQKRIAESERQRKELEAKAAAKAAAEAAALDGEAGAEPAEEAEEEVGIATVNFIVRADVMGSVEAVTGTIQEIGNNEVRPRILRAAAGTINESDVEYAAMSHSVIVNFNNTIPGHIKGHADEAGVKIIDHSVIYHLADDVKAELSEKLPDLVTHRVSAEAEVLQVFPINIKGRVYKNIAGCRIRNGTLKKTDTVRIYRNKEKIFDGKLESLKHGKKDVPEIKKGAECGIGCIDFQDLEAGDVVQAYEVVREKRTL